MEELLRCPVCSNKFQSTPMMLQCQHSMCKEPCLRTLKESSSEHIICPVCDEPHVVSKDGDPKTNITLENVLDLYRPYATTFQKQRTTPNAQFYSDEYLKVNLDMNDPCSKCSKCRTSKHLKSCFHCGRQVCTDCKESHLYEVRDGILTFSAFIREVCNRLQDIQFKFSKLLPYNKDFANKLKPIFQYVLQIEHDMKPYFESVEIEFRSDEKSAEDVLLGLLNDGESHLVKLTEIEINPLIVRAKTELEKHGILLTDSQSKAKHNKCELKGNVLHSQINQTQSTSQADIPPVPSRSNSLSKQLVASSVHSNAPGTSESSSSSGNQTTIGVPDNDHLYELIQNPGNQRMTSSVQPNAPGTSGSSSGSGNQTTSVSDDENPGNRRMILSIVVAGCVITTIIAIVKIGIASWSLAEDTGTMRKAVGSFLMIKCLFETGFVFVVTLNACNGWWRKSLTVFVTVAVVFGCFLIIDTVLAYLPEGDIGMAGKALQIVVITDWIWTVLLLGAVRYGMRLAQ